MTSKDKFYQLLNFHNYEMRSPYTIVYYIQKEKIDMYLDISKSKIRFPMIVKWPKGARWDQVFLAQNIEKLRSLLEIYIGCTVMVQEFIQNKGDIRVVIIGNKCVGSVLRRNLTWFKHNVSEWAIASYYNLPEEIQNECIAFTKKMKLDISWVDVMIINGRTFYIEFNDMPDYHPFEDVLGVDFDHEIIQHAHHNKEWDQ